MCTLLLRVAQGLHSRIFLQRSNQRQTGHGKVSWRTSLSICCLGNSRSFELPRNNNIWKREETKRVLKQCGLQFDAEVFLCQTGMQAPNGLPIGKVPIFCSASAGFCNLLTRRFGWCECEKHAGMYDVNWTATGVYNKELAKAILAAVRAGRKDP